jgi:hypothetical protein
VSPRTDATLAAVCLFAGGAACAYAGVLALLGAVAALIGGALLMRATS